MQYHWLEIIEAGALLCVGAMLMRFLVTSALGIGSSTRMKLRGWRNRRLQTKHLR